MLARGLQTKQVARALGISVKTADRHIQNAYRKIGVSTRAAADPVRDGARAGRMGRTPDCPAGRALLASSAARRPAERRRAKEDAMSTHTLDDAERRSDLRDRRGDRAHLGAPPGRHRGGLGAGPGMDAARASPARRRDTVLELAAGVGDTGFEAAADVGESGRLITTDFSPAMLEAARRRGAELGAGERRVPGHRRRADRARRRLGRRGAVPVRLHADGRPCGGARRDAPRPAPGRSAGAGGLGRPGAQPVLRDRSAISLVQRGHIPPPEPPPAPGPFSMASAERIDGAPARAPDSPRCGPRRCAVRFVDSGRGRVPERDRRHRRPARARAAGTGRLRSRGGQGGRRGSLPRFAAERGYELPWRRAVRGGELSTGGM